MHVVYGIATEVEERGFAIVADAVSAGTVARYREVLDRGAPQAGVRELLTAVPETRDLVDGANLRALLAPIVGPDVRIVRALLFDKSRAANWRVPWHQDLFVATTSSANVPGFSAWTVKDGVDHARAPREDLNVLPSDDGNRKPRVIIDDQDLPWEQFGQVVVTFAGWGARIVFVADDELDEDPHIEVRERNEDGR